MISYITENEEELAMSKKYYVNSAIVVLLMVLFRFIPPFGSMTALGMTILGIFLGAL